MSNFKCRICRQLLFTDANVLSSSPNSGPSGQIIASGYHRDDENNGVWFINDGNRPEWMTETIEEAKWTRGKLTCPKCGGRVGSFDFLTPNTRHIPHCGLGSWSCLQVISSRVDREALGQDIVARRIRDNRNPASIQFKRRVVSHSRDTHRTSAENPDYHGNTPVGWWYLQTEHEDESEIGCEDVPFSSTVDSMHERITQGSGSDHSLYDGHITSFSQEVASPLSQAEDVRPTFIQDKAPCRSSSSEADHVEFPVDVQDRENQPENETDEAPSQNQRSKVPCKERSAELQGAAMVRTSTRRERNRLKNEKRNLRRHEQWSEKEQERKYLLERERNLADSPLDPNLHLSLSSLRDQPRISVQEATTCPVCLDMYLNPYHCLPCHHVFCEPCLRQLARSTGVTYGVTPCPLCRATIESCQQNKELTTVIQEMFPLTIAHRRQTERKTLDRSFPLPGSSTPVVPWISHRGPYIYMGHSSLHFSRWGVGIHERVIYQLCAIILICAFVGLSFIFREIAWRFIYR